MVDNSTETSMVEENDKIMTLSAPSAVIMFQDEKESGKTQDAKIYYNVPYEQLSSALTDASNSSYFNEIKTKNTVTGKIETTPMTVFDFETQRRNFISRGYALDPSSFSSASESAPKLVGNFVAAEKHQYSTSIYETSYSVFKKRKRDPMGDPSAMEAFKGPWAGYEGENYSPASPMNAAKEMHEVLLPSATFALGPDHKTIEPGCEFSIFNEDLQETGNYLFPSQNRQVLSKPVECFAVKKIAALLGVKDKDKHSSGINCVKFFPVTGHLILSAGLDGVLKIWEVYGERNLLRSLYGHNKALKDAEWSFDGKFIASCSYDNYIKIWDSLSGKCLISLSLSKMALFVSWHPSSWALLATTSDRKILKYDFSLILSEKPYSTLLDPNNALVAVYEGHQGPVNAVCFTDAGSRFVSSSDDKTLRIWDWNHKNSFSIGPLKVLNDPTLPAFSHLALHPNGMFLIAQSLAMDKIFTFSLKNTLRQTRRQFTEHAVGSFSIPTLFSPDGKYVISGSSDGKIWIWDWNTKNLVKNFKAHDRAITGISWSPSESSLLATCSWDGMLKVWD